MDFTKPFSFMNLRSLRFTDAGFIFRTKNELNSFFLISVLENPPLLSPNVSYIRILKETDLKEVEDFCQLQTHPYPCKVELMISEPQSEI